MDTARVTAAAINEDELEWDNADSIPTAWDRAMASRAGRPRRTFGSRSRHVRSSSLHLTRFQKPIPVEENDTVGCSPDMSIFSSSKSFLSEGSSSSFGTNSDSAGPNSLLGDMGSSEPSKVMMPKTRYSRSHSMTEAYPRNLTRHWEENTDPNYLTAVDAARKFGSDQPGRKKIRARRHSTVESVLPLASLQSNSTSFSDIARLAGPLEGSPAKKTLEFELFQTSPTPSISSRKRLVCGSPTTTSEMEDWSTNSQHSLSMNSSGSNTARQVRTRSKIFSTTDDFMLPFAPSLEHTGRGAMDISTEDEESHSTGNSPDASFESTTSTEPTPVVTRNLVVCDEELDVWEIMASEEDIKFLVKSLRKENSSVVGQSSFGSGNNWSVTPPIHWSSARRSAFLQASVRLGFTLRSIGGSLTFLQILKAKGLRVLELCEATLATLKDKPRVPREQSRSPLPESTTKSRSRTVLTVPNPTALDDVTTSLAADMQSLTVNDTTRQSSASLVRHVTLEPAPRPPRPSLDDVPDRDMMLHLQGYSPADDEPIGKSSLNSTVPMMPSIAPMQNFDFVETPLMNRDMGWGSCPVQGRDWGSSCRCEEAILAELTDRFETAVRLEGLGDSLEGRCSTSSNLALDLEAHSLVGGLVVRSATKSNALESTSAGERQLRRRRESMAKRKRVSLWATAAKTQSKLLSSHKPLFRRKSLGMMDDSMRLSMSNNELFRPVDSSLSVVEDEATTNDDILAGVFGFLTKMELRQTAAVCSAWYDAATIASVNLMVLSMASGDDDCEAANRFSSSTVERPMERSWQSLNSSFPWGCFLSEGGSKRVYKVYNETTGVEEALSVMDVEAIEDVATIAAELEISIRTSSLVRRSICPNFVLTQDFFTCPYEPAASHWGAAENERPKGGAFDPNKKSRAPREPKQAYPGRFQYIRMELCKQGDCEELVKRQVDSMLESSVAQALLFQLAFALHAAADRFSMKHYDVKLLNVFVQEIDAPSNVVMRYGLGSHVFALPLSSNRAWVAKLADFGTANIKAESNGRPVTIAQFTTLENTPPDFLILGDISTQGHEHDSFGLGLCMLHLFTGHAPYEEIMDKVKCPPCLKKRLRNIWEDENVPGYSVVRSLVLDGVYKDEAGNIVDGEPSDTLYDTLYRFLVLFGIPTHQFQQKVVPKVWKAITDCLECSSTNQPKGGRPVRRKQDSDVARYNRDCRNYSVRSGSNVYIARARRTLQEMDGGLDLLLCLCSFDPNTRASALEVLNSTFMENLREAPGGGAYEPDVTVLSYTAFSTHY